MTDRGRNPDRLGDAIRELARTMAENGKQRMELRIVTATTRAVYEIRLLRTVDRKRSDPTHLVRLASDDVIEVEAFGPEQAAPTAASSRQMADKRKE